MDCYLIAAGIWGISALAALIWLRGATRKTKAHEEALMAKLTGKPFWCERHTELENELLDRMTNVHEPHMTCAQACVVHKPTMGAHRMLPLHWRGDRGLFERICRHGVGHPDPDQFPYWMETDQWHMAVHGCDGCCAVFTYPGDEETN